VISGTIARTTAALEAAAGQRPRGWVSPRGTPSAESARLLAEAGYVWQGDVFDDDRPYLQSFEDGTAIAAREEKIGVGGDLEGWSIEPEMLVVHGVSRDSKQSVGGMAPSRGGYFSSTRS